MPSNHDAAHDVAPNAAAPNAVALNAVARALEIDPARTVRDTPNAFTWWIAPGLRQHVQVEAGPPSGSPWLRIDTPVWRGADPHAITPLLEGLRHHARGAAVRHAPNSGNVTLVTRAPLPRPIEEDRATTLAGTGAIQALLAAWAWSQEIGHLVVCTRIAVIGVGLLRRIAENGLRLLDHDGRAVRLGAGA